MSRTGIGKTGSATGVAENTRTMASIVAGTRIEMIVPEIATEKIGSVTATIVAHEIGMIEERANEIPGKITA